MEDMHLLLRLLTTTEVDANRTHPPTLTVVARHIEKDAIVTMRMEGMLIRRLLRAVEHYKAACAADGVAPDAADTWLVLLAALDAALVGEAAPALAG